MKTQVFSLVVAFAAPAFGQICVPPPDWVVPSGFVDCCYTTHAIQLGHEWNTTPADVDNPCSLVSCPYNSAVFALHLYSRNGCSPITYPCTSVQTRFDSDGLDVAFGGLSVEAEIKTSSSRANWNCGSGGHRINTQSSLSERNCITSVNGSLVECDNLVETTLGSAYAVSARSHVFSPDGCNYYEDDHHLFDYKWSVEAGGTGGPVPCPSGSAVVPMVVYSRVRGTSTSPAGSASQNIFNGAMKINADGTVVRVGGFLDSTFNLQPIDPLNPNAGWTVSGQANFRTEYPAGTETAMKIYISDAFSYDGNVNHDQRFCQSDRSAFGAAMGSVFNDDTYNPRADFDFDQDVDASDYAPFNAALLASMANYDFDCNDVRGEAIDIQAAQADMDCNGFVTTNDLFAFLNEWFSLTLAADFNGDGVVTVTDLFDFQAAWFATTGLGC